ncbi:hypothetical protein D3C84_851320 [compost metagenome]
MEEQSITLLEFALLVCVISMPVLLFALFIVVFVLRRSTVSWPRIAGLAVAWVLVSALMSILFWLVAGNLKFSFGNSLLNVFWPALIATIITTAPFFLMRRK